MNSGFSTFISIPNYFPISISVSIMPCSTVSSLNTATKWHLSYKDKSCLEEQMLFILRSYKTHTVWDKGIIPGGAEPTDTFQI